MNALKISDISILEEKLNELAKNIFTLCTNFNKETGHGIIDIGPDKGSGLKITIMLSGNLQLSANILPKII